MSEMFEISEDGLVTIAASTMLGKNAANRPAISRANLLNTLDKEERYKKDSSIEALISASISESEKEFYQRMKVEYPRVCQMAEPLTKFQNAVQYFPHLIDNPGRLLFCAKTDKDGQGGQRRTMAKKNCVSLRRQKTNRAANNF